MNFCLGHVTDTTDITYFLSIMFGIFFKCMGFFFLKRNDQGTFSQKISMYILIFLWCSDCNAGIGMGFYEETFFENLRKSNFSCLFEATHYEKVSSFRPPCSHINVPSKSYS